VTLTSRQVNDLLTTHGLRPSRALGQNFVTDPNTVRRIARLADVGPGDRVLEIGPGLGSLTLALEETGAAVTAVEVDTRLMPVLEAVIGAANVRLLQGDAMKMDWAEVLGPEPGWVLVANLPYNIATPLIADLLDGVPTIDRMVIMVQREVGARLAALPGHPEFGAVSVKVAYWAEASVVGLVPPTVFVPRPKVESALVSIRRRSVPAVDPGLVDAEAMFRLVRAGFGKRRKMLRRSLEGLVPPGAFEAAEVKPDSRAENLDVYAWGRLAAAVSAASAGVSPASAGVGAGSAVLDTGSAVLDTGSAVLDTGSATASGAPDTLTGDG
jgi:16S rRNA (adenine1518-N6/adenine1519-N6)-dimethyltransferase